MKKNSNPPPAHRTIVLLDTHAIIHRAYHALPEFSKGDGTPTGALYGLSTMLLKIITDLKPDYVIACYDLADKTFRHEAYEQYKGTRSKTDDALMFQINESHKIFDAFGIPTYSLKGFEADDLLGTFALELKKDTRNNVIIASGDMDTLQLVDKKQVRVFTLKKGINDTIIYDEKAVTDRFGFKPSLIPDYKGLRGDPSDNIIGVKGIGDKTATTLITSFGTIESLYKTLKKNPEKIAAAGVTKRIIDLLLESEEEALFSKLLATIRTDAPLTITLPEKTLLEALDCEKLKEAFRQYEFRSLVSRVDTLAPVSSIKTEKEVPPEHVVSSEDELYLIALWLLRSDTNDQTIDDIAHFGGAHSLDEGKKNILNALNAQGLSYVFNEIEKPLLPIVKKIESHGILIDKPYLTLLSKKYHAELDSSTKKIYKLAGRTFNINSPKQLGEILFDTLKLVPQDKKKMKKTAGGARSTKESELEKLRSAHPIIEELLVYREIQKLLSTYIDSLPSLIQDDGRIHARFNQRGASTGRFSSDNPNLQNIPIKSERGKAIRKGFVAPRGYSLVSFDYSQIELRIAALLSQDSDFLNIFETKKDIHTAVAARVFNVKEHEVTHEMRRRAKVINFGILYGMGVSALQQNLGTSRAEAQAFHENYFKQFPTIKGYLDGVLARATKLGYTETLFGRRRYFPGLRSPIPFMRAMAERMAVNAPIQGTEADIIKKSIIDIDKLLNESGLSRDAALVLQVHDELVFEIKDSAIEVCVPLIEHAMRNVIPESFTSNFAKTVPIEVHVAHGKNWDELK